MLQVIDKRLTYAENFPFFLSFCRWMLNTHRVRYSNVSAADSRKDSKHIGIWLSSRDVERGERKMDRLERSHRRPRLSDFTYDESQTTQNDLLLLILLLGLMNLWRFTQYRQLSWVWYNVFIYAVSFIPGEFVLLKDFVFFFFIENKNLFA